MRKVVNFCDYFVICSGNSDRQVKAIADHIDASIDKLGVKMPYTVGLKDATWVILDAGDVVTHIFEKGTREFYNLEYLWQEAKKIPWRSK